MKNLLQTKQLNRILNFILSALFLFSMFLMNIENLSAQVSTLTSWTNLLNSNGNLSGGAVTLPTGTGSYRMLIVAIASSQSTTGTARTASVTYGTQTLSLAAGDMTLITSRSHTALYYLNEAGIDAAGASPTLSITLSGGTTRVNTVWYSVYDYVDQTSPITNSQNYNNLTSAGQTFVFGTALNLNYDDRSIEVISSIRSAANTTPRTITPATNWTMANEQTWATTDGVRNGVYNRSISTITTTDNSSTTISGNAWGSMTGISLHAMTKQYRSNVTTGNWSTLGTWQQSMDGGVSWVAATTIPANTDGLVTIQNGHTISLTAAASVSNLNVNGILDLSTFTLTGTGTLTVSSGGNLVVGGTSNFPTGFPTITLSTGSTVNYDNAGIQTLASINYYHLILSGSGAKTLQTGTTAIAGSLTLSGTASAVAVIGLSIGNDLIINSGTLFDLATFACNRATSGGTLTVAGTLRLGANTGGQTGSNFPTNFSTLTMTGGTVEYDNTGVQTVYGVNYFNLILSGSGMKTLQAGTTSIGGNFTISASATALLINGSNTNANSIILGTATQPAGTFGSTSSSATYKTDTYFSSSSGIITTASGCAAGTWIGSVSIDWNTAANWCGGIPTASTDVIIPSGGNQPNIGTVGGVCRNIIINSGATLTMGGSYSLTVKGNWTNNGGTFTSSTSTVVFNGTSQSIGGSSTTTFYNLNIDGNSNSTSAANIIIGGNLNIGSGTNLTIASNFTLNVTGTSIISGVLTLAGTGLKSFTNDVIIIEGGIWNETGIASINFASNLQNEGTLIASTGVHTFTGSSKSFSGITEISIPNITINGTYTNNGHITASTSLSGTGGLTQAAPAVLNIGGTSGITTLSATISGNTVNYNGSSQAVNAVNYYNLFLKGSGFKTLSSSTTTIGGILMMSGTASTTLVVNLAVTGNLDLESGSTLNGASYNLSLGGNWTNNGGTFNSGTGTVTFNDTYSSFQYMDGTSPTTFYNLVINHTSSAYGVSLSGASSTVKNILTLTNGRIILGNNNLIIASTGSISGGSLTSMIVPEGNGMLTKIFPTTGSSATFTFPVGNTSGTAVYSPAVFTATLPTNWNNVTLNIKLKANSIDPNLCQSLSNYLKRYWVVSSSGTLPTYTIALTFNAASDVVGVIAQIKNARYVSPNWTYSSAVGASSVNFTGLTTVGDFTGADSYGTKATASPNPICPGASSTISTTVCGGTSPTYAWSNGSTASSFNVSGLAAGTYNYTVTVTDAGSVRTSTVSLIVAPILISTSKTNSSCYCCNDGTVSLTINGGATPLNFLWSNAATTQNIAGLNQGTYNVTVTDAGGCIATASATITQPANPDAGPNQSICIGSSAQLNATTGSTFYSWTPVNSLDNPNIANPLASPTITTTYTLTVGIPSTNNLVVNGNFSQGNLGFVSDYVYVSIPASGGTGGLYPEGLYTVAPSPRPYHDNFWGVHDHTSGSGNYMIVNGAPSADHVWEESIIVQPNTWYAFSTWINSQNSILPAALRFTINGVKLGPVIIAPLDTNHWVQFYTNWNSGTNTSALIQIVDTNTIAGGNDFGLDDISFSPYCFTTDQMTVTVNPKPIINNLSVTVCSGANFTVTPLNGVDGIVPTGTIYSWPAPGGTGFTGGVPSSGSPTSISGTLVNTTSNPVSATYIVTPISGSCTGSTFTVTVTVNPTPSAPVVGTITQPTCLLATG
ncbi:MAG: PKD-like domain-containing protein, partial [Bacteroidales bacterium]